MLKKIYRKTSNHSQIWHNNRGPQMIFMKFAQEIGHFFLSCVLKLLNVGDVINANLKTQGSFVVCQWAFSTRQDLVDYGIMNTLTTSVTTLQNTDLIVDSWLEKTYILQESFQIRMISLTCLMNRYPWSMEVAMHEYPWFSWQPGPIHEYPSLSNCIHDISIIMEDSKRAAVSGCLPRKKW